MAEHAERPSRVRIAIYRALWFVPSILLRRRQFEADPDLQFLSARDARNLVDQRARALLGMTREEVLAALDNDTLPDSPAADEVRLLIGAGPR